MLSWRRAFSTTDPNTRQCCREPQQYSSGPDPLSVGNRMDEAAHPESSRSIRVLPHKTCRSTTTSNGARNVPLGNTHGVGCNRHRGIFPDKCASNTILCYTSALVCASPHVLFGVPPLPLKTTSSLPLPVSNERNLLATNSGLLGCCRQGRVKSNALTIQVILTDGFSLWRRLGS